MKRTMKSEKGFSFVHLLIALVVLQISALSLMYGVNTANQAKELSNTTVIAYRLANSTMEKTLSGIKTASLPSAYKNSEQQQRYTISVKSEPLNSDLTKVTVQVDFELVKFGGGTTPHQYRIESLVALP